MYTIYIMYTLKYRIIWYKLKKIIYYDKQILKIFLNFLNNILLMKNIIN